MSPNPTQLNSFTPLISYELLIIYNTSKQERKIRKQPQIKRKQIAYLMIRYHLVWSFYSRKFWDLRWNQQKYLSINFYIYK